MAVTVTQTVQDDDCAKRGQKNLESNSTIITSSANKT